MSASASAPPIDNAPRVRAVVLNYNRAALTLRCVQSLLAQAYTPLDIVVVDNGSAVDELAALAAHLPPTIILVPTGANRGYAAGNNVGLRATLCPAPRYALIVNNDITFDDNGVIQALVAALEADPIAAACSPLIENEGQDEPPECSVQVRRIPSFGQLLVSDSWWLRRAPGLRRWYERYTYSDQRPYRRGQPVPCESINGSCFLIRNDLLKSIGYLDENTFLYGEEIILGSQIKRAGAHALLVTMARAQHTQGATTGHRPDHINLRMARHAIRSQAYYVSQILGIGAAGLLLLYLVRSLDFGSLWIIRHLQRLLKRA